MKKYILIFLVLSTACLSCEEIIDVDLQDASPVLVAEGSIILNDVCNMRLTYTSDYFDSTSVAVEENAIISISDSEERSEILEYMGEGYYRGNIITGLPGHTFTLTISTGNEQYTARSSMYSKPELLQLDYEMLNIPHYYTDTIYTVKTAIVDDLFEENYYMFRYYRNGEMQNNFYSTYSDRLITHDTIVYSEYSLAFYRGDTVHVELYAIDQGVYNYFNLVNDVLFSAMNSSTPFNPASNFSPGILGYFMAASFDSQSIIID
ncbi:MAG: DUF4249 family protein [Bacteroidales bacterium]|jgi:hypothetical protein|nr:DUF4249 family protein [Bacteroidales bacterium]